jgi:hypothetical protein
MALRDCKFCFLNNYGAIAEEGAEGVETEL